MAHHNIEGAKHGKPYRIGYDGAGYAWRIHGETGKYWATSPHADTLDIDRWMMIQSGTLAGISAALSARGVAA